MPVPTSINDLSTTAANNSPAGTDTVTSSTGPDEYIRAVSSILKYVANGSHLTEPTGFRNKIINGAFQINQRGYASGAALNAGSYGHDRWKAGASGGVYSFTQNASTTTITLAGVNTLIQVVEDANVSESSYVLSWEGTAQARYAVNSATPAGAYAASPILITGQTVGSTMSIEFNAGTVGKVQLEAGSVATPFEHRPVGTELALCQRYYELGRVTTGGADASNSAIHVLTGINFKVVKRIVPNIIVSSSATLSPAGTMTHINGSGAADLTSVSPQGTDIYMIGYHSGVTTGSTAGYYYMGYFSASAEL